MSTLTKLLLALMVVGPLWILLRVAVIMERYENPHRPECNIARHVTSGVASSHNPKFH
jgi:hypothetical protein